MRSRVFLFALPFIALAQDPQPEVHRLLARGERAQAEAVASRWMAAIEARGESESPSAAEALDLLAECAANGRPELTPNVRSLVDRAIAIKRKTGGLDNPAIAASLAILGVQQREAGDYDTAQKTLERGLAIAERAHGEDSLESAEISLKLSPVFWMKGDYARCQKLDRHALAIYEARYAPGDPKIALALAAIGTDFTGSGDFSESMPLFERAAAIQEKALGPMDPALARTLMKLAFNLLRSGDYAQAKMTGERAVSILESTLSDRDPVTGEAERVLGHILTELGDYAGAERAQDRALAILEKHLGDDAVLISDVLIGMGNSAKDSGDYVRAERLFKRAVSIYEKRLGPENTKVGGALDNLGQTLILLKNFDAARVCFERAIAIQRKALGPRSIWVANLYQGLAKVAAGTGDFTQAKRLLEQNLEIWREQLGPTHPYTVVSMNMMADVLAHLGDRKAAFNMALEATRIRRDDVAFTVRTVDERQALRYAEKKTTSLDTLLALAADAPASNRRAAWDALIRTRALVLDEMAARHRVIRDAHDPEISALASKVTEARAGLARLVIQGKGSSTPAAYLRQLDDKRSVLYRAEKALALRSATFRTHVQRERAGFSEVSQALPAASALVAFARYDQIDYSSVDENPTPSYIAFILRGGDPAPRVVKLGPASRIDGLVAKWRAEIDRERAAEGLSERRNEALYRAAGAALRRTVWDPLRTAIAASRTVYIVPDGALQVVAFPSLPTGTSKYLIDTGPLLHTLSAERDIALPPARVTGHDLLAVGDPAYRASDTGRLIASRTGAGVEPLFRGAHSGCADFARLQFDALPASLREVRDLVHIWQHHGWSADALTGAEATEAAVKQMVTGKRVVHLATHGFFLQEVCRESAVVKENPLLRSGLAFAGADHRRAASPGSEDGILTAEEAASLDLRDTEWVVLSGCDTGLGDIKAGEGVLGLRRAFQEAGARTVITSLWPVEDSEAREWMLALYRARFEHNAGTAEAVRAATLRTLIERRAAGRSTHPFHWASFIAVGDWR